MYDNIDLQNIIDLVTWTWYDKPGCSKSPQKSTKFYSGSRRA